jgi:hypothetical protein
VSVTTDHGNGTYTAAYTGTAVGTAQTIGATLNGAAVTTSMPTVTVTAPGTFATPDRLNNASFETGFDGFTNYSMATPDASVRASDYAYAGTYSLKYAWSPNGSSDVGTALAYNFGSYDRIWVRYYFRVTNHINSTWKWARLKDAAGFNNFGGVWFEQDGGGFGNGVIDWGWDLEDGSILTTIGLTEAQVIDGNWHSLEFDFWRNGDPSGWPSVAFWFDGRPQYAELNGSTTIKYRTAGNNSYWDAAGRLQAGERSTSSLKLGYQTFMATLNAGNTTSGQSNIDRVAISSLGRIGP